MERKSFAERHLAFFIRTQEIVMKQKILAVYFAGISTVAIAGPSQFSGPMNTLGNVSTQQTILSATVNPAAGEFVVGKSYRWGYLSTFGLGLEVGDVNNMESDLDALTAELDRLEEEADALTEIVTLSEVIAVRDQFNDFLVDLGTKGTLQFAAQARAPVFPIAIRSDLLQGVVTLDTHATVDVGARFIDSPLEIVAPSLSDPNFRLTTDTVVDLSAAMVAAFSLGYSHDLTRSSFLGDSGWGLMKSSDRLLVGVELNIYQVHMASQLIAVDQEESNEELEEIISDELDNNRVDSTGFGLDLGILWVSDNFHVGATWKNINEPTFESSTLGVNCFTLASATARRNCEIAETLGANGRVDLTPEYVMESQVSVESAITTANKHWSFAGAFDVNEVAGPLKDDYQWATASASYFSDSLWIPMARVGFRTNFAGSELSYVSAGITAFGGIHLDVSVALDTIIVEGEEQPRAASVNLGIERRF